MNQIFQSIDNIYHDILGNLDDGVYIQDKNTKKIKWANKKFYSLLSITGEETGTNQIKNFVLKEGETLASTIKSNRTKSIDIEVEDEGKQIWIRLIIGIIGDKYIFGIIKDIEELITLQQALESFTERYQTFLQSITTGIVLIDSNGEIVFLNQHLVEMLEYSSAESLIGTNFIEMIHSNVLTEIKDKISKQSFKGSSVYDVEIECKDHRTKNVILSMGSVFKSHNEKWATLIVISDISDRILFEKMRHRFVEVTAHELRTPLTVIKGSIELLEQFITEEDNIINKLMEGLFTSVIRLEKMITTVHDLEMIEKGVFEVEKRPWSFDQFKLTLLNDLESWKYSNRIQKEIIIDPNVDKENTFSIDKNRVIQSILNLLENSCQHSESIVNLYLKWESSGIHVNIQDKGHGIPKEILEKCFQPFTSKMTTEYKGGLGLGLFTVKKIIDKHQGKISIVSDEKIGTKVEIFIPGL